MSESGTTPELRERFRRALNEAITMGRLPDPDSGLAHYTLVALRLVAAEHPNATPDLIASAFDAFLSEHARSGFTGTDE